MNNEYKSALDKITASDSFKNELIKNMGRKKKRRPKLPYITAIAACLAAAIALSVMLAPMSSVNNQKSDASPSHSFCLTAYAAEGDSVVNRETYVDIGRMSGYFRSVDWTSPDNGVDAAKLNGDDVKSIVPCFKLDLICEGKDIDTVTFSAKGSKFWINNYTAKYVVTDSKGKTDVYRNTKGELGRCYKSYIAEYDNQVKPSAYGCMELIVNRKTYSNPDKLPESVRKFFDWFLGYCRTQHGYSSDTSYLLRKLSDTSTLSKIVQECDKTQLYMEMLNDLLGDVSISVTVKYSDGTRQTQKIQLRAELGVDDAGSETDPVLAGKLI